jgi:hypothetical protein
MKRYHLAMNPDPNTNSIVSAFLRLNQGDLMRGLATAAFSGAAVAIFAVLDGVFHTPNFDVFSVDWGTIGHSLVNASIVGAEGGFMGYITKNLLTDSQGKLFGRF